MFLNLAWRGEKGITSYIEDQYSLARRAYDLIQAEPGFSCPYVPESNIVCFRYEGDDHLQVQIREQLLAEYARRTPAGPTLTPEDVAGAVYLLCLPEAAMITGHTLVVDGGYCISG